MQVSATQFDFVGSIVLSGSIDRTCRLWDVASGRCMQVKQVSQPSILFLLSLRFRFEPLNPKTLKRFEVGSLDTESI